MQTTLKIFLIAMFLFSPLTAYGEMTSTNYTIYADSIGMGGGSYSTSTSFSLNDTIGEGAAGTSTSTTYEVRGGYQAMDRGTLSVSLSSNSLTLGTLNASSVNTASTNVTISCDAPSGYTLSASALSGTMPAGVADGTVSSGSEEYGVAVSGTDSSVSGDVAIVQGLELASSNIPVRDSVVTLTFKASMASNSSPGDYTQSITLTAVANF